MVFYLVMVLQGFPVEMRQPYATSQECSEAGNAALTELRNGGHTQAYYFCLRAPKEES